MRAARACLALTLTILLVGAGAACADGGAPSAVPSHNPRGAYKLLGVCPTQPSPPPLEAIPGLHLPPESMIFTRSELGPLTQVEGFVDLTPIEVRDYYESADLEVIQIEDEGFETEALLSDGDHRMYVKARVLCRTGSNITATVGAESQAAALPTPAASPPPAP